MATEIERKFLVDGDRWRQQADSGEAIIQGYLVAEKSCSVRIRLQAGRGTLTIKGETRGATRAEFEYPIPGDDVTAILEQLGVDAVVRKTRYKVAVGDHVFEVDVFEGENQGLVIAEVELDREEASFQRPDWLAGEVTNEARYYNSNLARHPWRRWREPEHQRR